jgi:hypothetical protein
MIPQGMPTYVFSARCARRGRSSIGRSRPPRSHSAVSTAHSIAADDDSPAPTGTSEVSDRSTAGTSYPASLNAQTMPAM